MDFTECQVWTEGVFLPGRTFIETLETLLDTVDYAILVATPDDITKQRDVESFSMRDNVLLELGLFMAKLGRTRTYLVVPRDQPIHIPSDLLGIKTVTYDSPPTPEKADTSLTEPCDEIRLAMKEAERELSLAMRRTIVKRLLVWTNRVQGLVVSLQSESLRSLTDPAEFDRIRNESADRISAMTGEYKDDAEQLGVQQEARCLTDSILEAVRGIPFPEEAIITGDDVVSGLLSHVTGGQSVKAQVRDRFAKLIARYEQWWDRHGPKVAGALNEFQASLIATM
jgi:hypothetical protein